jgi:predicted ATP-grasp superfamily ATP-dependent carboligase
MVMGDLKMGKNTLPSVIIMGGSTNAISVARSLGREGIRVYAVNGPDEPVRYSRYCHFICPSKDGNFSEAWEGYLLGDESEHLRGSVLLACSDIALEVLIKNRESLSRKFVLDIMNKEAQLCMLNKLYTYEAAHNAGIPIPKFWRVEKLEQLLMHKKEYVYPLILKPVYSHKFAEVFNCKYFLVNSFDELLKAYLKVDQFGIVVMLVEKIPGPDDRYCSYYTYIDENGEALFDFTKRIIRRYPYNQGLACYHITDWNPEVRDLGLKYFNHVRLIGLANVEFKRDDRDGKLKLIECNARFTAANCLVAESGFDLALFVYNRLVGQTQPTLKGKRYKEGLRLWYPVEDFSSFKELRGRGELSFLEWLKSIMHPQVLPYFRWYDPIPTIVSDSKRIYRFIKKKISRFQLIQKTYWKNRFEAEVKEQRD